MKSDVVKYHAIVRFLERLYNFDIKAETVNLKSIHQTQINDTILVNFLATKYQLNLENIKQQIINHVGEYNLKIGQHYERDGLVYVVRNRCVVTIYPKLLGVKRKMPIDLEPHITRGIKKKYEKKNNRLQGGIKAQASKKHNRCKHKLLNAIQVDEKNQELKQALRN